MGNGKQIRCFTHVSDISRGIILALESSKAENQDFNIGSEEEMEMIDLAKLLWEKCNINKPFKVKYVPGFKYDIKRRVPTSAKARTILGWKPEKKLDEELPEIITWIKRSEIKAVRD